MRIIKIMKIIKRNRNTVGMYFDNIGRESENRTFLLGLITLLSVQGGNKELSSFQ